LPCTLLKPQQRWLMGRGKRLRFKSRQDLQCLSRAAKLFDQNLSQSEADEGSAGLRRFEIFDHGLHGVVPVLSLAEAGNELNLVLFRRLPASAELLAAAAMKGER